MEKQRKVEEKAARYVIRPGDTLSAIAARHRVSVASLRSENRLKGDRIRVGQVLKIPRT
jgi:LysM repeat protein